MKYGAMRVFSVLYTIFALAALLLAIELVLTAYGKPFIPADFWQEPAISSLFIEWEMDNVGMFLSGVLIFWQVFCVIFFIICRKIGNSIMMPLRQYDSKAEFRAFTRRNLLLYSIGSLFLFFSIAAHILEAVPRGMDGEMVLVCIFFGIPGLIFAGVAVFPALGVILAGEPSSYCYCGNCNYGSLKQFRIMKSEHLYDNVKYETTTTTKGGSIVNTTTRETGRDRVYRDTYSCVHCGNSFTMRQKR